ncbi:ATP12-domain-containing protein [Mycena maculata]|uniref:ATP12-domain-containing protein n=1 Tax=Mycena maculata TaxID=230809 RepID=A0AAD7IAP4_9AGAR|nr:ATP12-domain-containing protein [Mycena maculata]
MNQLSRCLALRPAPFSSSLRTIRWNSSVPHDGPPVTETNRTEATMKRFWKQATVGRQDDSYTVLLDHRALKTPSGNTLLLPPEKSLVATLVAAEWENQETMLKHHALPMTALTSRAIDEMVDEATRAEVRQALLEYLDTDTICFYQDYPPQLVDLQAQHWDPLLTWARSTFDIDLHTFDSLLFNSQPSETKSKMEEVLSTLDHWEMAAMERATYTTKSFIIALALVRKHLSVEQASLAAQVEVASQIQRWGEVEDTHDVDFHDVRRQLGSAACLLCSI